MSGDDQALVEVSGPSGVVPELALQPDGRGVLVWRFATPVRAIATTVLGGGIGEREWAVNAEVGLGYDEADPAAHVASIAPAPDPASAVRSGPGFLPATRKRVVVRNRVPVRNSLGVRRSIQTNIHTPC